METGVRPQPDETVWMSTGVSPHRGEAHRVCCVLPLPHIGVFAFALLGVTFSAISTLSAAPKLDDTSSSVAHDALGGKAAEAAGSTASAGKRLDESKIRLKDHVRAGASRSDQQATSLPDKSTWEKFGTLGTIVLVLGLCGVTVFLFRRMQPTVRDRDGNRVLEVLGRVPVSSKQQVALVRVGSRVLALGVSSDRLTCLSEITESSEVIRLMPTAFDESLQAETIEHESAEAPTDVNDDTVPFRDELSRLRGMVAHWRQSAGRRRATGDGGAV